MKTASDGTLHNTTKATLPTKTLFATRMVNAFAVEASCKVWTCIFHFARTELWVGWGWEGVGRVGDHGWVHR